MGYFKDSKTGLKQNASGQVTYGVPVPTDTIVVNGTTLTCVADTPDVGQFSVIAELTALIAALTGLYASDDGAIISVEATAPGIAGNAVTLALGEANTGTMSVSGPTLTGGVASTESKAFETAVNGMIPEQTVVVVNVSAVDGTDPTVTVTPQVSMDKDTWFDRTATAALAATGAVELHVTDPLVYMRFSYVLGGTLPVVSLDVNAAPSLAAAPVLS